MKRIRLIPSIAGAAALACAAPLALAQTAPPPQNNQPGVTHAPPLQPASGQSQANQQLPARIPTASASSGVMGQHDMAGTVQSVSDNGMVVVQTGLGNLTVHFPAASQHLKKGDRIVLHLSYSIDSSGAPGSASSSKSL